MITPDQIRAFATNALPKVLRAIARGEEVFPLDIKRFGRADTSRGRAAVRAEIELLLSEATPPNGGSYSVDLEEVESRNLGSRDRLPSRVYFATEIDYLSFVKATEEVRLFRSALSATCDRCPALASWVPSNLPIFRNHLGHWEGVLRVAEFFVANPRPNLYVRELPIAVDTKFIENNAKVLELVLKHLIPEDVAPSAPPDDFCAMFHLKDSEPFVEVRVLDENLARSRGIGLRHFKAPCSELARLPLGGVTALVIENRTPGLTLPEISNAVALFGMGDAVAAQLRDVQWLKNCKLVYWGDIDDHGFEALSTLRESFGHVDSILMDRLTFEHHEQYADSYTPGGRPAPASLTPSERDAFNLTQQCARRVEQERVTPSFANAVLCRVLTPRASGGEG